MHGSAASYASSARTLSTDAFVGSVASFCDATAGGCTSRRRASAPDVPGNLISCASAWSRHLLRCASRSTTMNVDIGDRASAGGVRRNAGFGPDACRRRRNCSASTPTSAGTSSTQLIGDAYLKRTRSGASCSRASARIPRAAFSALRPVDMRRLAEKHLGRFHHRFGQRRMRMNRQLQVGRVRAHLDGQHALGDQLAGPRSRRGRRPESVGSRDREGAWSCRPSDRA